MIYFNNDSNKEIKDNEILFLGCSHTAGIGHGVYNPDAKSMDESWPGPHDIVYPHIFCKYLQFTK